MSTVSWRPVVFEDSAEVERRLLAGCDPEQVEAITTDAAPLLIVAGAGSGKTRVLTRRIAWRVSTGTAVARAVVALTFSRKAAEQLRTRLGALGLPEAVRAGTFHAVALSELRRLALERRVATPVVLSSKVRLLADVTDEARRPQTGRRRQGSGRSLTRGAYLGELAQEIEWAKARLVPPGGYERAATLAGRVTSAAPGEVAASYSDYEKAKLRRRLLDFEDLLTCCAAELDRDPLFAASARFRMAYVFVDEYQDVNAAQLRLLKAWLGDSGDLCTVGDPAQAIYAWNGSDPAAIGRFAEDFAGARVLRLVTNYRCTPEVVAVASAALGGGEGTTATRAGAGGPVPTVESYGCDAEEAEAVAAALRLDKRPGRSWSAIAVLARTNAQLGPFEEALERRLIPWRRAGASSFADREAIRGRLAEVARCTGAAGLRSFAHDLRAELDAGAVEGGLEPYDIAVRSDLSELARLVEEYLGEDAAPSGRGFRTWLETTAGSGGSGSLDAVTLATFHRSKGLEWSVVYLTGLEEGLVPIAHARDDDSLAEERRLLYVSCTRAEEELHCSWARERRFTGSSRPSPRSPSPWLAAIETTARRLQQMKGSSPSVAREAIAASRRFLAGT